MESREASGEGLSPSEGATDGASAGNQGESERPRLGLMGGSFDPVHAGHLYVARAARERAGLDEVLFVPAARPPHKPDRVLSPGQDRMAMLQAALSGEEGMRLVDLELDREGPSYTYDTVLALEELLGGAGACELHLILGGDNLPGLGSWREVERLLERVTPLVVYREEDLSDALAKVGGDLPRHLVEKLRDGLIVVPPHPASSTALRERLACGEDPGDDLPAGCMEIVRERGLYGWSG